MRRILRITTTIVAFILAGLAIFTAETVADAVGYTDWIRALVRDGWLAMLEAGYAGWIQVGAIFFAGGATALWVDLLLRRDPRPSPLIDDGRRSGRAIWSQGKGYVEGVISDASIRHHKHNLFEGDESAFPAGKSPRDGSVMTITLSLSGPLANPAMQVFSGVEGLLWRLARRGKGIVVIDIFRSRSTEELVIEIVEDGADKDVPKSGTWYNGEPFRAAHYPRRLLEDTAIGTPP